MAEPVKLTPERTPRLTLQIGDAPLYIPIPHELSLRVAKLHVIETAVKWLKGPALTEAIKKLRSQ
jgi:hypothetical protein